MMGPIRPLCLGHKIPNWTCNFQDGIKEVDLAYNTLE